MLPGEDCRFWIADCGLRIADLIKVVKIQKA